MSTGFLDDTRFERHFTWDLPEKPTRIQAIRARVRASGLVSQLVMVEPYVAPMSAVERVHGKKYLTRAQKGCEALGVDESGRLDNDADVIVCRESWETALLSAGAAMAMCDAVMSGRVENGFASIRPPGHHAEKSRAMGFCILANAAIAARHLQDKHGLKKVAIVDWDVHHGNGTQHIFESDPSVLFISLHEHPAYCYPGTGYATEVGKGKGKGFTINIPLMPGTGNDHCRKAFVEQVIPALQRFEPEALIISAGFDAHRDDPLAELEWTSDQYAWMTGRLKDAVRGSAQGRIISLLEGGYNVEALAESVEYHLRALAAKTEEEVHMNWKSGMH